MKVRVKFYYNIEGIGFREYDDSFEVDDPFEAVKKAVIEVARTTPMSVRTVANQIIGSTQLIVDGIDINEKIEEPTPAQEILELLSKSSVSTADHQSFIRYEKKKTFNNFLSRTSSGKRNKRKW